jgi:hypothetical protein
MNRYEIGLNEAPVTMRASNPAAIAGATSLVRPVARFALRQTTNCSSSSGSDARVPLKKRAIREGFCGDNDEIPEPPRLRRQRVIYWGEDTSDRPMAPFNLFASEGVDFQIGLGCNNKKMKSRGDAVPLFGSWNREPLFVDDDTDSEMELESLTKLPSTQQGRVGWTEMQSVAVTPSPHPMETTQSPPPFPVVSQRGDVPTTPMSPPPLQYYLDADADVDVVDQEGSDWFISSKMNELTRLHKHEGEYEYEDDQCEFEHDYAADMDMHHRHDSSPNKSGHPLLAKLPGFPKPGGTLQDMMKELIIPTPNPTPPPSDFGVHHHHYHGRDNNDPTIFTMQHPGAFATTNGWFEINSSFSPARIDRVDNNDGNDIMTSENHDSTATGDQPLFLANTAGRISSAFAPGQARNWYGAVNYNASG